MAKNDYQLKFVICSEDDFEEILQIQKDLEIPSHKICLMPQGISSDRLANKMEMLVKNAIKYGFNVTPRMHVDIWGHKRGV